MAQDPLSLAKLIASRICHDLISPVGAIANGMELVALTGADITPEFELISDSVAGANARIKFYRIALGMSSADQKLGRSEIGAILRAFYNGTRLTCAWEVQDDCRRTEVQAAFLALLCVASALPTGGQLTVEHDSGTWNIFAQANLVRADEALWASLTSGITPEDLETADVQFAMLPECASTLERRVRFEIADNSLLISF